MAHRLHVIAYHYVRDLPHSAFPRINGMHLKDFHRQVLAVQQRYEMATLETTLAFLNGDYEPSRDLCLLTFDDGLKEHYVDVAPFLADHRIQGQFFLITSCLEDRLVVPVHMSHFLMASLGFSRYRDVFMEALGLLGPPSEFGDRVNPTVARGTYRWDSADVASFKYLLNFRLDPEIRDGVLRRLFVEHIGPEAQFSESLYVSWAEARVMQSMGMVVGGHSHSHRPLGLLREDRVDQELTACRDLLAVRLGPESCRTFCYPYGNAQSYSDHVISTLRRLGFACSFTTSSGSNRPRADPFTLRRVDCNDVDATSGQVPVS